MLTDSEVDRRFSKLIADLNTMVQTVDWPSVSEPVERPSQDDLHRRGRSDDGIGALRVLAAAVAVVTVIAGIVLGRTLDLGIVPILVWFAVAVPGLTLAIVMIVDRLRRRR